MDVKNHYNGKNYNVFVCLRAAKIGYTQNIAYFCSELFWDCKLPKIFIEGIKKAQECRDFFKLIANSKEPFLSVKMKSGTFKENL